MGLGRQRRGFSPIISTVILTSTILMLVISTSFIANDVLTSQVEGAEFEVSEDVLLAVNSMIKEVLYKPTSSRYVKAGFRTSTPHLLDLSENISAWARVDGGAKEYLVQDCPLSVVKIRGGSSVTVPAKNLSGTPSPLLSDFTPLGHVHVQRTDRSEIVLNYARVRCVHTGSLNITQDYNVVEAVFVNMTTGSIDIEERAVFVVKNLGNRVSQHFYEGDLTIGVNDTRGYDDSLDYSSLPHASTLVNMMVVDIEISIIGGL